MRTTLSPIHQTSSFDDHDGFFSRLLTKLNTLWVMGTYPFAGKGRKLSIHFASEISRRLAPRIRLGNRVVIGKHTWFHVGMEGEHELKITVDDDCCIAPRCTITAKNSIHLERDVVLGSDVLVMDHNHAYHDPSKLIKAQGPTEGGRILIQEGCRIGQGVAVLCDKGELVLGRNCTVAPGAVVTRSFPPGSVLSGNPARVIQKLSLPESSGPSNVHCEVAGLKHVVDTGPMDSSLSVGGDRRMMGPEVKNRVLAGRARNRAPQEDPLSWVSRLAGKLRTLWLRWTYPFAAFGTHAWVHYSCHVARSSAPYISIGEKVGLARDTRLDVSPVLGANPPVLILEPGSSTQRRCVISVRNRVHIMRNAGFGPSVLVTDHGCESQKDDSKKHGQKPAGGTIRIEEDCWIGFGTLIACDEGELVIGRHSVVGANSIITRSIPPYSVVAGDPARIVKQYDFSENKWVLGRIRSASEADRKDPEFAASALKAL